MTVSSAALLPSTLCTINAHIVPPTTHGFCESGTNNGTLQVTLLARGACNVLVRYFTC